VEAVLVAAALAGVVEVVEVEVGNIAITTVL
jgi:hypothetical protein